MSRRADEKKSTVEMTIRLQQQQEMGIYCETAEVKELNETEME